MSNDSTLLDVRSVSPGDGGDRDSPYLGRGPVEVAGGRGAVDWSEILLCVIMYRKYVRKW